MDPLVDPQNNLNRFTTFIQDLTNYDEKILKDQFVVVLLNSITNRYRDLKNALEYRRDGITTDIINSTLRSKVLEMKSESKESNSGDNLLVKRKGNGKSNYHSKSFMKLKEIG